MSAERTVILGGQEFTIKPLTLGQIKQIGASAAKQRQGGAMQRDLSQDWAKGEQMWYDATIAVAACGLRMKPEEVEAIEGSTLDELTAVVSTIYEITGLVTKKDGPKPGEAQGATTG